MKRWFAAALGTSLPCRVPSCSPEVSRRNENQLTPRIQERLPFEATQCFSALRRSRSFTAWAQRAELPEGSAQGAASVTETSSML